MENNNISTIQADEIIRLLEEPTDDRRPLKHKLQRSASVKELVKALTLSQVELTRRILCDILAARKVKSAIPALLECLDDPSPWVKDDAAEALGKIGSIKAGEPLLNHFNNDRSLWLAVALGAIGYRPAIPSLIASLSSPYGKIRGGAAWALGELRATEAITSLELALSKEDDKYALDRIREALDRIIGKGQ